MADWPATSCTSTSTCARTTCRSAAGSRSGRPSIEVSEQPHTGCAKFSARFGSEALRWINSPLGRAHRLRGLNARVVEAGTVRQGDLVRRV